MAKMGTKDMDKENEMAKQQDKEREEKIRREIAKWKKEICKNRGRKMHEQMDQTIKEKKKKCGWDRELQDSENTREQTPEKWTWK